MIIEQWLIRTDPQGFESIIYREDGYFVARVYAGEDREKYASMIAAAPNMLAVLNAVRIILKNRDQRPEEMKLLDAIKMVVAQAEGALNIHERAE